MSFDTKLKQKQKKMNEIIGGFLPKESSLQKDILDSMAYSITVGGKRLRPILMYETYQLFGNHEKEIYPFLAAIEMIHSYSLVHDDLPAMDNDDYRRGQLTTHKKFGEALGVLTGDALLNYAFEIMSQACLEMKDKMYECVQAMQYISHKAGIYGMIGGQVVDIQSENKSIDLKTLEFIHEHKTAALLEASMVGGAMVGGACEEDIKAIQNIAYKIGLAFQIQDDILDVTSDMKVLGKPVNSDKKNNKSTYVQLVGIEASKDIIKQLSNEAIEALKKLDDNAHFLIEIVEYLIYRKK
ncbi:geranylgeranyl diphosphate synthase type II [Natranaerovirga hydrolytica]|uniref:Farnesyl diphosphate synthase n=1 Tax=Natranaerovirga hydrolytica TaxID=680378 RepID=A0A4R1MYP4_9FIRM|nr:farnesyl diphosphate synthase [Natranaerovirga hydrolytica]TCK98356.1 geranylgeranyl diphosphate synthase type II [Natranaerovirga hydrolytica]